MKLQIKKQLLLLTVSLLLSMNGFANTGEAICANSVASGNFGEQTWNLTETMTAVLDDNGSLTISTTKAEGEAMPDYVWGSAPWYSFRDNINSVVIKDKVTAIGVYAFHTLINLTDLVISNSVISIGESAFVYCIRLEAITIPDNVKLIGGCAFQDCLSLSTVSIGKEVTTIGHNVFWRCESLKTINVKTENTHFSSEGGILFDKSKTTLIKYPAGKPETNYILPNSVNCIYHEAFSYSKNLREINIGSNVIKIGQLAFRECTNLIKFINPSTIPQKEIDEDGLVWFFDIFNGVNLFNATLYVPIGTKTLYAAAPVWKDFGTIEEDGQTEPQVLVPYLYLQKTDGNLLEILFTDSEILLQDDKITVKTPSQQYQFAYDDVDNFSFQMKKSGTQIKKVLASSSIQVFLDDAGFLHISGNQTLRDITVYNITGHLLKKINTNNVEITIDISNFPKGIYLVKTYEKTMKIIK